MKTLSTLTPLEFLIRQEEEEKIKTILSATIEKAIGWLKTTTIKHQPMIKAILQNVQHGDGPIVELKSHTDYEAFKESHDVLFTLKDREELKRAKQEIRTEFKKILAYLKNEMKKRGICELERN